MKMGNSKENNSISDGFGSSWPKCELKESCGLHIVRPGKCQCWCDDVRYIFEPDWSDWDLAGWNGAGWYYPTFSQNGTYYNGPFFSEQEAKLHFFKNGETING